MSSAAPSPASISSESSLADSLLLILDDADFLVDFLGSTPEPESPEPLDRPPLELPPTKNLRLPSTRLKLKQRDVKHIHALYRAKVNDLRRAAQTEYGKIAPLFEGDALRQLTDVLKDGFKNSMILCCDQAVACAHEAHRLAMIHPIPVRPKQNKEVKKPFNKRYVAIFEYIFDTPGGNYLRMKHKRQLAQLTGMTYRQITVWFQNRRARTKRKVQAGKAPEPMTLEKALDKLKAERQKANPQQNRPAYRTLMVETRHKLPFEDEDGNPIVEEEEPYEPCFQEKEQLRIMSLYAEGALPNLDAFDPPRTSFPAPYKKRPRREFTFKVEPSDWPRQNYDLASDHFLPVTDYEVTQFSEYFDDVLELTKTEKLLLRRKIKFKLPLPPLIRDALKIQKAFRPRQPVDPTMSPPLSPNSAVRRAMIPGLDVMDEDDLMDDTPHAGKSDLSTGTVPANPALSNRESDGGDPGAAAAAPSPGMLDLTNQFEDNLNCKSATDDEESGDDYTGDQAESYGPDTRDNDTDKEEYLGPSSYAPPAPPGTIRDPMDAIPNLGMDIAFFKLQRHAHPAASLEPQIPQPEDDSRQTDIVLDDKLMRKALRRTLRQLGYEKKKKRSRPSEPRVYTHHMSFDPRGQEHLSYLLQPDERYTQEPEIPLEDHIAQLDAPHIDPFSILVDNGPEPLPPAAYERSQPLRVKKQRREEIADIGGIPISDLFDPQGMPLPLALLEAAPYTTPTAQAIYDYCMPPVKKPRRRNILPPAFPCNPYFPVAEPSYHYPFHPVDISSLLEPLPAIQHVEPAILAEAVPAILADAVPTVPAILAEPVPTVPAVILADPADLAIPAVLLDDSALAELVAPAEPEPAAPPAELAPEPGPSLWPESDPELDPEPADDWTMLQRVISWACKRIIQTTTWDVSSTDPLSMLQYLA